jgi:hypothetical protein
MIYEKCRDILLRECELVQAASIVQEKIRQAVLDKDWPVFEDHLNAMSSIEAGLDALEIERNNLFTVFEAIVHQKGFFDNMDDKGRFYSLVSHLPESQRNDLTSIYRSLKVEAIKLRLANDTLLTYLSGVKATIKDFFELAFPDRAGKIYTSKGTHFSHDMRSMVLNTHF